MVLSDRSIKEELAKGRIVITPFNPSCIQPASVEVHLDRVFRVFKHWESPHYIDLKQELDGLTQEITMLPEQKVFSLQPGHFVLGQTIEYIEMPNDLMGRLEGKSSLGRIGLLVHSTAGYIDPGFRGRLTLELYNVSALPILLYPGEMKISQISFHRLTTPAERPYGTPGLGSKYQGQTGPTPTQFHREFPQGALLSIQSIPAHREDAKPDSSVNYLREWLRNSEFKGSVVRFAKALNVPVGTVEKWLYRGRQPSLSNRRKLFELTKLPQFSVEGEPKALLEERS